MGVDMYNLLWNVIGMGWKNATSYSPECPYDELEQSRRFPHTPMSLPARLLLCEGYIRAQSIKFLYDANPQYDMHEDAHQTAQALACGEFD